MPLRSDFRGFLKLAALASVLLTGCALDRRSMGSIIDDQATEVRLIDLMHRDYGPGRGNHIKVVVHHGWALLIGEVQTETQRKRAESMAASVFGVDRVINELSIGEPEGIGQRASDGFLTGRAKSALLFAEDVPGSQLNLASHRGVVYLMGRVTEDEGERAAKRLATVRGVSGVVKVLDYISNNEDNAVAESSNPGGEP